MQVDRARIIASAVSFARDLGNQPGNILHPAALAGEARKLAKRTGLTATVLDEKRMAKDGFGGMLAVGSGSLRPPRMILLEYRGGRKTEAPIALIGKAITFDSGGISIKPAANMEAMVFDKCGGTAVIGAMAAIAELGLKRNIVAVVPAAENLPSATAYRPGDIIRTYDGRHVEIISTDAEGRVVLADAIGFARKKFKPAAIVDLATLTGACGVALGDVAAGLWSTSDTLKEQVVKAAAAAGERVWPMPLYREYDDQIKSDVALIKNTGGKLAGACTAAAFLKTFVDDVPWAHLDVAYTASYDNDRSHIARGATGYGIRLLVELIENWRNPLEC